MPKLKFVHFLLTFLSVTTIVSLTCYALSHVFPPFALNCKVSSVYLVIVIAPLILLWISRTHIDYIFAGMIWGGALSNFLEFINKNCVNDYLNFFNLVRFNLADVFICIGILLLIRRLSTV